MLEIDTDVLKGTIIIKLKGILNSETIGEFDRELNYLFYKQGFKYFVFDFKEIDKIQFNIFEWLDNKLTEIFLGCGKVRVLGLKDRYCWGVSKYNFISI